MSRTRGVFLAFLGCAAVLTFSPTAQAQIGSTMRGTIVDINGLPIPEVKAEFVFKGETRVPIVKVATTDKKGQYVRVGLKSGNWEVTFTKAGFKPRTINTWLSGDALSETPPVTMPPAPLGEKAVTSAAEAAAQAKEMEQMKQLGATYKQALDAMNAADYVKAESLFKEVLLVNPSVASAHHNLGYVYMQQNNADAAEESYRKAIESDPNKGDSYIALAALLAAKGKVAEGFELMNGVAALFGQDAKFQFVYGIAASNNSGKEAEALAAFTKVSELDPTNVECLYYLGTMAINRNDIPAATGFLGKYIAGATPTSANLPLAQALLDTLTKTKKKK